MQKKKRAERIRDLDVDSVSSYYFLFPDSPKKKKKKRSMVFFLVYSIHGCLHPKRIDNIDDSTHTRWAKSFLVFFIFFFFSHYCQKRKREGRALASTAIECDLPLSDGSTGGERK